MAKIDTMLESGNMNRPYYLAQRGAKKISYPDPAFETLFFYRLALNGFKYNATSIEEILVHISWTFENKLSDTSVNLDSNLLLIKIQL